jgi:magnesium transporter
MYFFLKAEKNHCQIELMTEEQIPQEVMRQWVPPEKVCGCKVSKCSPGLLVMVQIPVHLDDFAGVQKKEIPLLGQGHHFEKFVLLVTDEGIYFADYDGCIRRLLQKPAMSESLSSPAKMLYRLFQLLVEDDRRLFDVIYGQLAALEQEIPRDNTRFFYQKMYVMKRTVYERFRYYQQLVEVGEDLMEWECELLEQKEMQRFERFLVRTSRLADDMEILREYTMEIWEIYQSQISIRQNDIMKVLTIVTTIFLPLTLLVGWYGMNFETMPELSWKYGYGTVIFVSASIVLFLLLFFRKKKYW